MLLRTSGVLAPVSGGCSFTKSLATYGARSALGTVGAGDKPKSMSLKSKVVSIPKFRTSRGVYAETGSVKNGLGSALGEVCMMSLRKSARDESSKSIRGSASNGAVDICIGAGTAVSVEAPTEVARLLSASNETPVPYLAPATWLPSSSRGSEILFRVRSHCICFC